VRLLREFLARPPSARVLMGALVVSIGWSVVGFPFFAAAADEEPWILVFVGLVVLAVTLWQAVLIRRLHRGVPRTGRRAVITLVILTLPALAPPFDPLFIGLAALVFGMVTLALVLARAERQTADLA
jgi:uncharacterized membrane protein HdeD (DUF308 family)